MGRSKHRKAHKQKVNAHKQRVQDRRAYVMGLTQQLEAALLQAETLQTEEIKFMEDQPTMFITGEGPKEIN